MGPACRTIICAQLDAPRAWPAAELAEFARRHCTDVRIAPDVANAMDAAFKTTVNKGTLIFTGTFYAIDRVLDWAENPGA
jgi:folylpolyglutamate synthase/dihydropteroate synthase